MQGDLKPSVTETRPNVLANKILYNMLILVFILSVVAFAFAFITLLKWESRESSKQLERKASLTQDCICALGQLLRYDYLGNKMIKLFPRVLCLDHLSLASKLDFDISKDPVHQNRGTLIFFYVSKLVDIYLISFAELTLVPYRGISSKQLINVGEVLPPFKVVNTFFVMSKGHSKR